MLSRDVEKPTVSEPKRDEHKSEHTPEPGLDSTSNREAGNSLTRLGKKLKRWYLKNGNTTFIPDTHLIIIDDDRS